MEHLCTFDNLNEQIDFLKESKQELIDEKLILETSIRELTEELNNAKQRNEELEDAIKGIRDIIYYL